jgi:DNA-binding MurR/RpiR family transcriptional regulator
MKQPTTTPAGPAAAASPQALSGYIRSRFDEFSRSQKDVAQYIVDHLDEAAFQTAEELARRANTSSSTVVRFSQALGFEGFPELQQAARDEYRRRVGGAAAGLSTVDPLAAAAPLFSLDHTEFEAALAADHVNVEDTAHKLSRSDVESAVDAIVSAEKVLIAGTDQMAFFASYLRHLLMLLDLRAEVVASPSQEALGRLSRIDASTLVIGLSAGRPHPLITRTMKLARHRKAPTWRSPTRRCRRSPGWPGSACTTRPTRRPSCARTRRCCRSSRRSPTGSTRVTPSSTTCASRRFASSRGAGAARARLA